GRWITKTEAMKKYRLASSDMDSILPITDKPSPHHHHMRVKTYNVRDVAALSQRLCSSSSPAPTTETGLATPNGPEIMRTTAMNEFGLKSLQMDRIRPVRILPNPHRNGTMRFYNRCDV
ncbi:hypothetical protein K438DRAFT_1491132, partial [Mycena galopus ATCC 62051]